MSKRTVRKQEARKSAGANQTIGNEQSGGATVNFHGMCGVLESASCVLMPNRDLYGDPDVCEHCGHDHNAGDDGHVMAHKTRLLVPMNAVALNVPGRNWLPDEVVVVGTEELGIWNIDGRDVYIVTDQAPSATKTVSGKPARKTAEGIGGTAQMLRLGEVHPESTTRADWAQVPNCARVWLGGGTIIGMAPEKFLNAGKFTDQGIASYLSWSPANAGRLSFLSDGQHIVLTAGTNAEVTITNSAVAPGQHFSIMYSLLKTFAPPMISPTEKPQRPDDETYPGETCKPPMVLPRV